MGYIEIINGQDIASKIIEEALLDAVNTALSEVDKQYEDDAKNIAGELVAATPEMRSLAKMIDGDQNLAGQFGLPAGTEQGAVNAIWNAVADATSAKWNEFTPGFRRGGLIIKVQPKDFANLLALPQGFVHATIAKTGQNYSMHWLQWLLERGDETIVANYQYQPSRGFGRSKVGIMKSEGAESWGVPTDYAGTRDDNFITRALRSQEAFDKYIDLLKRVIIG